MFDPEQEPSNYPTFNTPDEIADDLGALGFDVVSLANNHMLDVGSAGLLRTIERLDKVSGVTRVGAYKDQADHGRPSGCWRKTGCVLRWSPSPTGQTAALPRKM